MIKNKNYFYIALILLMITMVLNFPFPHTYPYGEEGISIFTIPITTVNGFHYLGIFTGLLLFLGLYFLAKSLNKYQIGYILLAVIFTIFFPLILVNSYQKTLASEIYAISYDENTSKCSFETVDEKTLRGICEFTFENYSKKDVQFAITFYDKYLLEEDRPMLSMMNNKAPYQVTMQGKERKVVKIETDVDVSKIENHIDYGEAKYVNIVIEQGKKKRNL